MRDEEFRALGYRICLQVHDELVCRGPLENLARADELLRLHMTSATANGTPLLFPVQVSSGHGANYFEAK
jgi:DNA polymerase I-like protein with 3'-5' exonuclease and polymerase domains